MEDLINMRNNTEIKMKFSNDSLENFWASQLETYPVLAKKALTVLVPFATTYLCVCLPVRLVGLFACSAGGVCSSFH